MCLIDVNGLNVEFGDFKLNYDRLCIEESLKIAIIGENGSGKSTLLLALSGNLHYQGDIKLLSKQISLYSNKQKAKHIAFLPQFSDILFGFSVFEVVLFGRYANVGLAFNKEDYDATYKTLGLFNLTKLKDRSYKTLSGGEKRRVMIARTFNQNAEIFMLDEPFANLDIKHTLNIIKTFKTINKTIIASIHDINLAVCFFDIAIVLKKGKVLFSDSVYKLNKEVVDEAYEIDCRIHNNRFMFF